MAFELIIQEQYVSEDGKTLGVKDISDWTQAVRSDYAVVILANYIPADLVPEPLEIVGSDPLTDAEWGIILNGSDGRIQATGYAIRKGQSDVLVAEGAVRYLEDLAYIGYQESSVWREATEAEAIAGAEYTSNLLDMSVLMNAYTYKMQLNMDYITKVKYDLANGAKYNELYYKRTDLDYVSSLIAGAEFNFGLALYTLYYDIVANLDSIVSTGKLS